MTDHEKVMSWLEGLTDEDWRRYHSDSEVRTIAKAALEMLKEQEQTIEALKEKLRLLEYGNHDCVQDVLMPAT